MVGAAFLLGSFILSLPFSSLAGTACADSGMDWYTNLVGETPCRTYERLRQICNPQYQVGDQNPNTPPDFCDEQVADCCCNSISFSLSMLCLTCQQGFSKSSVGFDAGVGAYQDYLTAGRNGFCSPNVNKTLPNNIQQGVCNQKIKIFDDLYGIFWSDGSWFYEFTQQTINKNIATFANNTFTHCDSTTIHSTTSSDSSTSSSSSSSTPSSSSSSVSGPGTGSDTGSQNSSSSSLGTGAIAGIAIGGLAVLILSGLIFWWWRKQEAARTRRRYTSGQIIIDGGDGNGGRSSPVGGGPPPTAQISPFPYSYSSVPTTHSRTTSFTQSPFGDQNAYTSSSANVSSVYPQSQSGSSAYGSSAASGPGSGYGGSGSGSDSGPVMAAGAAGVATAGVSNAGRSRSTRKHPLPPIPSQNATQHSSERDQEYGFDPYSTFQPQAQNSGSLGSPSERHTDGGPVPESMLQRSVSGRLPPAYGEQFGN